MHHSFYNNITCEPRLACGSAVSSLPGMQDMHSTLDNSVPVPFPSVLSEPKSGTRTSTRLALGGLAFTCTYLQTLYGERSCHTEERERTHPFYRLVFEPEFDENAPCTCDGVKR